MGAEANSRCSLSEKSREDAPPSSGLGLGSSGRGSGGAAEQTTPGAPPSQSVAVSRFKEEETSRTDPSSGSSGALSSGLAIARYPSSSSCETSSNEWLASSSYNTDAEEDRTETKVTPMRESDGNPFEVDLERLREDLGSYQFLNSLSLAHSPERQLMLVDKPSTPVPPFATIEDKRSAEKNVQEEDHRATEKEKEEEREEEHVPEEVAVVRPPVGHSSAAKLTPADEAEKVFHSIEAKEGDLHSLSSSTQEEIALVLARDSEVIWEQRKRAEQEREEGEEHRRMAQEASTAVEEGGRCATGGEEADQRQRNDAATPPPEEEQMHGLELEPAEVLEGAHTLARKNEECVSLEVEELLEGRERRDEAEGERQRMVERSEGQQAKQEEQQQKEKLLSLTMVMEASHEANRGIKQKFKEDHKQVPQVVRAVEKGEGEQDGLEKPERDERKLQQRAMKESVVEREQRCGVEEQKFLLLEQERGEAEEQEHGRLRAETERKLELEAELRRAAENAERKECRPRALREKIEREQLRSEVEQVQRRLAEDRKLRLEEDQRLDAEEKERKHWRLRTDPKEMERAHSILEIKKERLCASEEREREKVRLQALHEEKEWEQCRIIVVRRREQELQEK